MEQSRSGLAVAPGNRSARKEKIMYTNRIMWLVFLIACSDTSTHAQPVTRESDALHGEAKTGLIQAYIVKDATDVTGVASRVSKSDTSAIMTYLSDPDRGVRWRSIKLASCMGEDGRDIMITALNSEINEVPTFALSECPASMFRDKDVRKAWITAFTKQLSGEPMYGYRDKLKELCETHAESRAILLDAATKGIENKNPCQAGNYVAAIWNLAEYKEPEVLSRLHDLQAKVKATGACKGALIMAARADLGDASAVKSFAEAIADATPSGSIIGTMRLLHLFRPEKELYMICRELSESKIELGTIRSDDLTNYRICDLLLNDMAVRLGHEPIRLKRFGDNELQSFREWLDVKIEELDGTFDW